MSGRRVAIIGGGLAGLAAAVRLAEAGEKPIIIETRKKLGGRATSFIDPRSGELLDNCQHVLMGCCTNLIDFYDRIGVIDRIEWHRTLYWAAPPGEPDSFRAGRLPAPLHFLGSFRRMKLLDAVEKRALRRAMGRLIRIGAKGRIAWGGRTFRSFLNEMNQPESLVEKFWTPVVVSACNLEVDRVGAPHAMQVFQEGFLANRWSYTMGLPAVQLIELYDPAKAFIESRGGEVHLGLSAQAIAWSGGRVNGVVTRDALIEAAAIIAAVPPDRLDRLLSDTLRNADPRLQHLQNFDFSPILGVHLFFDQPIMKTPHLILPGRDTHWLFNKGENGQGEQAVHAVISAADSWMEMVEEEIIQRVMRDIHHALPESVGLHPVAVRAVKEKRATFAATPEIEPHRPSATPIYGGGVRNLFLAGDWTDTGWPATMEGAVRSGYAAAGAYLGDGSAGLIADVPPGPLAWMMGLRM